MRPRRVPTRRVEDDLDRVGSRGDRTQAHSHLACLESRIAVQSKDSGHTVERARGDDVECSARHDFLGGLEYQPNPDGKFGQRGQSQSGAEQDGGVGVVPACMGHTGDCGRVRRSGRLLHRQSVHVGAQCDSWTLRSDIARETGATGKDLRRQSSGSKAGGDEFGGRVFAASQLRVGMDVSTPRDEVVGVARESTCRLPRSPAIYPFQQTGALFWIGRYPDSSAGQRNCTVDYRSICGGGDTRSRELRLMCHCPR